MQTYFKGSSYEAFAFMHYRDTFLSAPSAKRITDLMHEFGRRWGKQKGDSVHPGEPYEHDIDNWDRYIGRILDEGKLILDRLRAANAAGD